MADAADANSVMVRALAVSPQGDTLFVGGRFDTIDDSPRSNLAAVDASTGDAQAGFEPDVVNVVNAIIVGPERVYFGGAFRRVNTIPRSRLAAVSPGGALDPSWIPSADSTVRSLVFGPSGQSIFVGGKYTTMDGQLRQSVARVSIDTGALDPWAIPAGVIDTGNMA